MDVAGASGLHQSGGGPAGVIKNQHTASAVASAPRTTMSNSRGAASGKHSAIGGGGMWSSPERERGRSGWTPARNMPVDELDALIVGSGWVL